MTAQNRAARCGSYPFLNIAQDHGVPYEIVLAYADAAYEIIYSSFHWPSVWATRAERWVRTNLPVGPRAAFLDAILKANNALYRQRSGEFMEAEAGQGRQRT